MTQVALAASQSSSKVAVIDFTTPSSPKATLVASDFVNPGCTVALCEFRGVIGSYSGPTATTAEFRTIDVTNPADPKPGLVIPVKDLAGIGAIAIDPTRTYVATGERNRNNGGRVMVFDINGGTAPIATVTTSITQMTSVTFYGKKHVVVAGRGSQVGLIDFSVSPPTVSYIDPGMGGDLTAAGYESEELIAVGEYRGGPVVKLYKAPNALVGQIPNGAPQGTSIGLYGHSALCGTSGANAYLVDFEGNPAVASFPAGVGNSGMTVNRDSGNGVCGGLSGPSAAVALFDLTAKPPKPLGVLPGSGLPSIQSIALSSF
jgi:hypothetical protein